MEKVVVGLKMGMNAVETAWRWKKVAREERWVCPARWDGNPPPPVQCTQAPGCHGYAPGGLGCANYASYKP